MCVFVLLCIMHRSASIHAINIDLIGNLGISENFGTVDFDTLTFPPTLRVDYVRVYQRSDSINIGCDPEDFPTAAYIEKYVAIFSFRCRG